MGPRGTAGVGRSAPGPIAAITGPEWHRTAQIGAHCRQIVARSGRPQRSASRAGRAPHGTEQKRSGQKSPLIQAGRQPPNDAELTPRAELDQYGEDVDERRTTEAPLPEQASAAPYKQTGPETARNTPPAPGALQPGGNSPETDQQRTDTCRAGRGGGGRTGE